MTFIQTAGATLEQQHQEMTTSGWNLPNVRKSVIPEEWSGVQNVQKAQEIEYLRQMIMHVHL